MTMDQEEKELGLGRLESPESKEPDFPEPLGEEEEPEEGEGIPSGEDNDQPGH